MSSATNNLAWVLDGFAKQVPGVERVVTLSQDGLPLAGSNGLPQEDIDRLAAAGSGLKSLAKGTGEVSKMGTLSHIMAVYDRGYVFVMEAGPNACVVAQANQDVDAGQLAYEMTRLVTSIGEKLGTEVRPS